MQIISHMNYFLQKKKKKKGLYELYPLACGLRCVLGDFVFVAKFIWRNIKKREQILLFTLTFHMNYNVPAPNVQFSRLIPSFENCCNVHSKLRFILDGKLHSRTIHEFQVYSLNKVDLKELKYLNFHHMKIDHEANKLKP